MDDKGGMMPRPTSDYSGCTKEYTTSLILQALANASACLSAKQIADATGLNDQVAARRARELYREGIVGRERVSHTEKGGWHFEYTYDGEMPITEMDSEGELWEDYHFWAPVREAAARARPNWRIGELAGSAGT